LGELRIAGRRAWITLRHDDRFVTEKDDLHLTGTLHIDPTLPLCTVSG
jgi:hypothetical protein